jgi:peptidoglycan/LPS O-acetylase OafA/YrhL
LYARHHIEELQSLRGAAALTVAISHLSMVYALPLAARAAIDSVFNAHASVIVFFVLSGYVLTGSILRRGISWQNTKAFYIARVFRLFPALWVASAISSFFLLLHPLLVIRPAPTFWFDLYLHPFPSVRVVALSLLAIDKSLIMPVWTVFIELMGSAIMPLVVAMALARPRLFTWALFGAGLAAYSLAYAPHRLDSLSYMFDFMLGAWLASGEWPFFAERSLRRLLGAAFVLIFFRTLGFTLNHGHIVHFKFAYSAPLPMLVEGIAAFFLIGELASERGGVRLLRNRWFIRLGDVSYSLYLIHFPVAILVAKVLSSVFSDATSSMTAAFALMPVGLTVSLLLAFLMYRFVELPSIALGKRVSRQFSLDRTREAVSRPGPCHHPPH